MMSAVVCSRGEIGVRVTWSAEAKVIAQGYVQPQAWNMGSILDSAVSKQLCAGSFGYTRGT